MTAIVEPQQAQSGDTIQFTIVVSNSRDPRIQNFTLPARIRAGSPSTNHTTRTNIINGRMQQIITSQIMYPIAVDSVGTFTIPAQTVLVDGTTYTTEPVSFSVTEPPVSEQFKIIAELGQTSAYVGEPVELTITWILYDDLGDHLFALEGDHSQFEIYKPRVGGSYSRTVRFEQLKIVPDYTRPAIDGAATNVLTFRVIVVPTQTGRIDLGAVLGTFSEMTGIRRRGFRSERTYRRSIARSDSLVLEVKPLPIQSKPDGFTGLIGAHIIAAEVSPAQANIGDPLTLRIKIAGPDPFERITPPRLEAQSAFAESFKLSPEGWLDTPTSSSEIRTFETTIRATHDGVRELPPIELPYFDPVDDQYHVATSRPFPLTIRPTRQITAQDAIVAGAPRGSQAALQTLQQTPLTLAPISIHANARGNSLLRVDRTNILAALTSPTGLALTAAPPTLYALALLVTVARRRRDPARIRRHAALRAATHRSRVGNAPAAMQHFLADWFDLEADALTSRDAQHLLAEQDSTHAQSLASMMRECEEAHSQSTQPNIDHAQLTSTLTSIHKELLRCYA